MHPSVSCRGFQDHHAYSTYDIESILETKCHLEAKGSGAISEIHTTEKDLMRLKDHIHRLEKNGVRLIVHPVEVRYVTLKGPLLLELVDHYTDYAVQQATNAFPQSPSPDA